MQPIKTVRPLHSNPLEDGFKTNDSIHLKNRNFRTGISIGGNSTLTNVTSPSLFSGSESVLRSCKINSVKSNSYLRATDSTLGSVESEEQATIHNCIVTSVKSHSYLNATDSNIQQILSKESATLKRIKDLNHLVSISYLNLDGVCANRVESGESCTIVNCPQIKEVKSHSYLKATNSKLLSSVYEEQATIVSCKVTSLESNSYLKATGSSIEDISSKEKTTIHNCKVTSAKSGSYFEATSCSIKEILSKEMAVLTKVKKTKQVTSESSINAQESSIKRANAAASIDAKNSRFHHIKAGKSITLFHTTVKGKVRGYSLRARDAILFSVRVSANADLITSAAIKGVHAKTINANNCSILGQVKAKSIARIKDCQEVGSVRSGKATLVNSRVIGDVEAIDLKMKNTVVQGIVTSSNLELVLNNCTISKLTMKKPKNFHGLSTAEIHEICHRRGIPQDIYQLVEYILLGHASIQIIGKQYIVKIGESTFGITAGYNRYGNSFQNFNYISGVDRFVCESINITSHGYSISDSHAYDRDGNEYPIQILNNPQKILEAQSFVELLKEDIANEKKRRKDFVSDATQVVVVCGGHIDEISFEVPGGIVNFERGGTVGKIINGYEPPETLVEHSLQISIRGSIQKTPLEPPEYFLGPIFLEVMSDPYITPHKQIYDKREINEIMLRSNNGTFKCPLTTNEYKLEELKRNDALREEITEWLKFNIPL